MKEADNIQLASFINTTNPKVVISEVKTLFSVHYPKKYFNAINKSYRNIKKLFEGKFPGYKACNTEYHNLNHTLDAFLATSRLIYGYNLEEEKKMPLDLTIDLLISSMFHDTGYIQEEWDNAGTGAKYTKTHIGRSIAFLDEVHLERQ